MTLKLGSALWYINNDRTVSGGGDYAYSNMAAAGGCNCLRDYVSFIQNI